MPRPGLVPDPSVPPEEQESSLDSARRTIAATCCSQASCADPTRPSRGLLHPLGWIARQLTTELWIPRTRIQPWGENRMTPVRPKILPWVSLAIIYVVWGSTYMAIRIVVREMPPMAAAAFRFAVAGAVMAGIAAIADRRHGWPSRRQWAEY